MSRGNPWPRGMRSWRSLPGTRISGYPRIPSISPISPSGCRILSFVKGTNAKVCSLRKMGKMGLGNMGASSHFSPVFLPLPPLSFAIFLPLVDVVHAISILIPISPPSSPRFIASPPHYPHSPPSFPIFPSLPIFPRRLWGIGDFGFGYKGALASADLESWSGALGLP